MEISRILENEYDHYDITISREEFDDLVNLCCYGGEGFLTGFYEDKCFKIFPDGGFSYFWTQDDEGYFTTVGIYKNYFSRIFDGNERNALELEYKQTKFPGELEKAINESGRKPIESVITSAGRTEIMPAGYITMKVEPRKKARFKGNYKLPKKKAKAGLHLIVNNESTIRIKSKPRGKLYLIVDNVQ